MSDVERWVDELMPDEPMWVRDLVDEELAKRGRDYDALRSRLAAAEAERDEALVTLKTMLVADMTRNRDLWIKTWAKVPVLTAGVQIDAHLLGEKHE